MVNQLRRQIDTHATIVYPAPPKGEKLYHVLSVAYYTDDDDDKPDVYETKWTLQQLAEDIKISELQLNPKYQLYVDTDEPLFTLDYKDVKGRQTRSDLYVRHLDDSPLWLNELEEIARLVDQPKRQGAIMDTKVNQLRRHLRLAQQDLRVERAARLWVADDSWATRPPNWGIRHPNWWKIPADDWGLKVYEDGDTILLTGFLGRNEVEVKVAAKIPYEWELEVELWAYPSFEDWGPTPRVYMAREDLTPTIASEIVGRLLQQLYTQAGGKIQASVGTNSPSKQSWRARRAALNPTGDEAASLMELLEQGKISPEEFEARLEELEARDRSSCPRSAAVSYHDLDPFTAAYIETALWSSHDEQDESGGEPLDQNYTEDDIAAECLTKMIQDCQQFQTENANVLAEAEYRGSKQDPDDPDIAIAGYHFWLTRNGHGAGFWDGDWSEPADEILTEASERFGEFDLYIGEDNLIYCQYG